MTPSIPHILIVDNNSPFVLPLLRCFRENKKTKIDVLVFTRDRVLPFRRSRYISRLFVREELTADNLVPVLKEIVSESGASYLIPTREWISALISDHREALERIIRLHPLPPSGTLEITGDKWKLNIWLKDNGFPSAEATPADKQWEGDLPFLLKPRIGIAGEGIRRIGDLAGLDSVLSEIGFSGYFLMEFIPGHDIDISFFAMNGEILIHTIQKGIVCGSFTYSRGITFVENDELLQLARKMVRKLDFTGIAHLDFRYSEKAGNTSLWISIPATGAQLWVPPSWAVISRYGLNPTWQEEIRKSPATGRTITTLLPQPSEPLGKISFPERKRKSGSEIPSFHASSVIRYRSYAL